MFIAVIVLFESPNIYKLMTFKKLSFLSFFVLMSFLGVSQTTQNLVGYYHFDDCTTFDYSPSGQQEAKFLPDAGSIICECGVEGQALSFDGIDNQLIFLGTVNNQFSTTDFTLSFYFKPYPKTGLMDIVSKRSNCDNGPGLAIRYKANSAELIVEAVQDSAKRADFKIKIDHDNCWHHVALVREGNRMRLYYNAELVGTKITTTRINMKNSSTLNISGSPCLGVTDTHFRGLIDEFRVYNRALTDKRIKELYFAPDKIINSDTIVYIGESVQLNANSPCGITYQWLPDDEMNDGTIPNPIVMPSQTTTYSFQSNTGQCISRDEITITVVDPNEVNCEKLLFPSAFTPNNDGLNETFSFDTPLVVLDEFKLLEIFDRWGNRVFYTDNPAERWDGKFAGQEVNPGVFLYRVQFVCKGEEQNQVGQVTLIR